MDGMIVLKEDKILGQKGLSREEKIEQTIIATTGIVAAVCFLTLPSSWISVSIFCLSLFLLYVTYFVNFKEEPDTVIYKVTFVKDCIPVEFLETYEIINQEGKIYTVKSSK